MNTTAYIIPRLVVQSTPLGQFLFSGYIQDSLTMNKCFGLHHDLAQVRAWLDSANLSCISRHS